MLCSLLFPFDDHAFTTNFANDPIRLRNKVKPGRSFKCKHLNPIQEGKRQDKSVADKPFQMEEGIDIRVGAVL